MTKITVRCTDQVLTIENKPEIASGGVNENIVEFSFCDQWEGFAKTAVFYQDKNNVFYSLIDEKNTCTVPKEVTEKQGAMFFGVFGLKDDVRRTSNIVKYNIKQGAIVEGGQNPSAPTPDIYEQLLAKYSEILNGVSESNEAQKEFIENANDAVSSCNQARNDCYAAINNLNMASEDMDGGDPSTEDSTEENDDANGGNPY